jgi:hypothetical protein
MIRRAVRLVARGESWLPLAIGAAWWLAMYPGLFGEDSLMNLSEALTGPVSVWFTAWWIYVIRFVTIGGRVIPLLTLFLVLMLTYAVREWARACFRPEPARALALILVCASPLVGALGIQVRHDIPMTAGLLLCLTVMARSGVDSYELRRADYAQLIAAVLLISTRHNGLPTILGAAVFCAWFAAGRQRKRWLAVMISVAAGIVIVTQLATRASGNRASMDPLQSVEWALADISCLLSQSHPRVSDDEWQVLGRMADPADWPNAAACRTINNELFYSRSFRRSAVTDNYFSLLRVWLALAAENPWTMARVHFQRVRLFLPPFMTGVPTNDQTPFIHSTILSNELGLHWVFPRAASAARFVVRAWNASKLFLANVGLWLLVLLGFVWRQRGDEQVRLLPTVFVAVSLEIVILATAPISEGRYGLPILICGHMVAIIALLRLNVIGDQVPDGEARRETGRLDARTPA